MSTHIYRHDPPIYDSLLKNKRDMLDLIPDQSFSRPNDLGVFPSFEAVFHGQPDVLRLLHSKGVDLNKFCDTQKFGLPLFYAVYYDKLDCIQALFDLLGEVAILKKPCDKYGYTALQHAARLQRNSILKFIENIEKRPQACVMLQKTMRRWLCRRRWVKMILMRKASVRKLQKWFRGRYLQEEAVEEEDDNEDVDDDDVDGRHETEGSRSRDNVRWSQALSDATDGDDRSHDQGSRSRHSSTHRHRQEQHDDGVSVAATSVTSMTAGSEWDSEDEDDEG